MSIIELGALGEFLGSIGVVATLIYLAIQIRQNTHSLGEGRKLANGAGVSSESEPSRGVAKGECPFGLLAVAHGEI